MKLTVIGGCGSRSLMLAKCLAQQAESLGITEVVFMDTDKERNSTTRKIELSLVL